MLLLESENLLDTLSQRGNEIKSSDILKALAALRVEGKNEKRNYNSLEFYIDGHKVEVEFQTYHKIVKLKNSRLRDPDKSSYIYYLNVHSTYGSPNGKLQMLCYSRLSSVKEYAANYDEGKEKRKKINQRIYKALGVKDAFL